MKMFHSFDSYEIVIIVINIKQNNFFDELSYESATLDLFVY